MPSQGRWYHFVIAGLYALFLPFFFCVWSCLRCCPHCWEVVIYRGYRALTCNEDDDLQTTAVRTSIPAISIRRQDPTIHDYFEELLRFELATTMTVTDQDLIITTAELESLNPASPKGGGICGGLVDMGVLQGTDDKNYDAVQMDEEAATTALVVELQLPIAHQSTKNRRVVSATCAICLETYQVGHLVTWSPLQLEHQQSCPHAYHTHCIRELAMSSGDKLKCPLCRQEFV